MKTLILLIFSILSFSACGDKDAEVPQSTNSFFCKIDGVDFKPQFVNGLRQNIVGTQTQNLLITGSNGTGKDIQLFMKPDIKPGTYSLDRSKFFETLLQGVYNRSDADADFGFNKDGTLTITENNTTTKRIKGTFNFVTEPLRAGDPVNAISAGTFDVTYEDI